MSRSAIVVVFGLMGTGKTTLARELGAALNWPVVHSDAVRKILAGLSPTTRMPLSFGQGIYSAAFSIRTYDEMRRMAAQYLAAAPGVILDGSYTRAAERAKVQQTGRELGARVLFVQCVCPPEVALKRMRQREQDPCSISDGRPELAPVQAQSFDPIDAADPDFVNLDTDRELTAVLRELKEWVAGKIKQGE